MVTDRPEDVKLSELLSLSEAARLVNLNPWQLLYRIKKGHIEAVRLPTGSRAVPRAALERYLREQQ